MAEEQVHNITDEVKVEKAELLKIARSNRENHRKEFELALEGWHDEAIKALDRWRQELADNKRIHVIVNLPPPEDHTRDYDLTIRMLEMHTDDRILIARHQFAQIVMDDWGWKQQWETSNATYLSNARTRYARMQAEASGNV